MSTLPSTKAFFRKRTCTQPRFAPFVDMLLIPFLGVALAKLRATPKIAREIKGHQKSKDDEESREEMGDPFLQFFSYFDESPDLRSARDVMADIFRLVNYVPDQNVSTELEALLAKYFDEGWRDDRNKYWEFDEEDIATFFRHAVWTVRQLEELATRVAARKPLDLQVLDLVIKLRDFSYDQARSLFKTAQNVATCQKELGPRRFCPVPAVVSFWKTVGVNAVETSEHPVDRVLVQPVQFLQALRFVKGALDHNATYHEVSLAEWLDTTSFARELGVVLKAWGLALNQDFHLGPTSQLLTRTLAAIEAIEAILARDADSHKTGGGVSDTTPTPAYLATLRAAFSAFQSAAKALFGVIAEDET